MNFITWHKTGPKVLGLVNKEFLGNQGGWRWGGLTPTVAWPFPVLWLLPGTISNMLFTLALPPRPCCMLCRKG